MSLRDELLEGPPTPKRHPRQKAQHPKGWEPSVTERNGSASVVVQQAQSADERGLLKGAGLDPDEWRIVDGTIETRRWQQTPGDEWLYYYKFRAVSASQDTDDEEFRAACKQLLRHKVRRPKKRSVEKARVFCISDTQIGKGEGGGSEALANRVEEFIDRAAAIVKSEKPDAVYILGLGDIVERCWGNYPGQPFKTDLAERAQERFARRMVLAVVKALAPHAPRVVIASVGGNHGQNRTGSGSKGEGFTDDSDNADVAVFEQVADICKEAPAYDHVEFVIPDDDLSLTLDICGTVVGIAHGHQFGSGANPQKKAIEWWKGQALGGHPLGDAEVFISGHYHHLQAVNTYGKMWFQCPSADGGSKWWTDKTGEWSQPGFLTLAIDGSGVRDFSVLWSSD